MCLNPTLLPNGQEVGCRQCWQCKSRKVDDWVGRCIAESKTALHTHAVGLTYGGGNDTLHSAVLMYSDVQRFFWNLRNNGYRKFRYFVVGEYGSTNQRAHWHLVMFWYQDYPPEIEFDRDMFTLSYWPEGFSHWSDVNCSGGLTNAKAVKYVCKYITKNDSDEVAEYYGPRMSKKPPLGHEYFKRLAQRYVQQGLAPQSPKYSFPDASASGKRKEYYMTGKTCENFLEHYVRCWLNTRTDFIPSSELVEEFQDKQIEEDLIFKKLYEGISDATQRRQKYEAYLRKVKEIKYKDVEAWFSCGDVEAVLKDGTEIYREKEPDGIELWQSRNKDGKRVL